MKSKVLYIMFLMLNCLTLNAQEFSKMPTELWIHEDLKYPDGAFYINDSLFIDGQDHTEILQKIINKHRIIVLPSREININYKGVNLRSNSQIYFREATVLKMIPNDRESYSVINVVNSENIKIYNPQLVGDREIHRSESGEWGMGISIRSSNNISVLNANIKNMWGDGIYIGKAGKTKKINDGVWIYGGLIDYTRRNGISVTSGKNIKIENVSIYNIYGTNPMEGIDIEPNKNSVALTNIELINIKTYNAGFVGIAIALDNLRYLDEPNTKIDVIGHVDRNSKYGFRVGYLRNANGVVNVLNSKWLKNKNGPLYFSNIYVSSLQVNFKNNYMDNMEAITEEVARYYINKNRSKKIRLKNYNFN